MFLVATAAASATSGIPAAAATSASPALDRPSILQTQDLSHRNDAINLPPTTAAPNAAAPRRAVGPRIAYNNVGLQREVLGFATYWELASGNLSDAQWDKVSTVTYFGLTLNSAGGFDNDAGMTGWNSAALTTMINNARAWGDRAVLTVKNFSDASINPVVSNASIGQTAISNIITAIKAKGLDGVNIDFEGTTSSSYPNIQTDYTNWVASLSQQLHAQVPGSFVSLDAYSGSASWSGGFMRIDTLAPYVDAFFIMAYDMTAPNDLPNAPLGGPYTYTDTSSVDQYLSKVGGNGSKVILGVPYYGYKFSTSNGNFNAPVTGGQATPAYSDVRSDIQCASGPPDGLAYHWDAPSSTPWLSWISPASGDPCGGNRGSWRETYYDDPTSLGAKYDLVNARNIRGVGMWALGYDHGYADLWQSIYTHFSARWSGWYGLGGSITSKIAIGNNADGRLEIFVRGTDGALWHKWQTPGGIWGGWYSLGGGLAGDPQVATNRDGRLEAFTVGTDGKLWHNWQVSAGGGWTGWYPLAGSFSGRPALVATPDGRLVAIIRGTGGAIWGFSQTFPGGGWSSAFSLGGTLTSDPAAVVNADGRLEVLAHGTDSAIWHTSQVAVGGGWAAWSSLGGSVVGTPAAASNLDGRIEVFARGTDNAAWHAVQSSPGASWTAFSSLGGSVSSDPAVDRNRDGRLELFTVDTALGVNHTWENVANGIWLPWASLSPSAAISAPTVGSNSDGRLEVMVQGTDHAVYHDWQTFPGGGS